MGEESQKVRGGFVGSRQFVVVDCICGCPTQFSRDELRAVFQIFNEIGNHELQNSYLTGLLEFSRRENFANGEGRNIFTYRLKLAKIGRAHV